MTDKQPTDVSELVRLMNEKKKVRKRFLIKAGNKLSFIPVNEVALFLSEASTTFLVTRSNERFILDQTLDELAEEVSSEDFFRINRKFLVGIESIEKVEPYFNNRLLVHTYCLGDFSFPTLNIRLVSDLSPRTYGGCDAHLHLHQQLCIGYPVTGG